jgi:hypothetical protein
MLGGQVTVSDRRFSFVPNRVDTLLKGRGAEFPLSAIRDIRLSPGGREAMRERGLGALKREQVEIDVQMADSADTDTFVVTVRNPTLLMASLA